MNASQAVTQEPASAVHRSHVLLVWTTWDMANATLLTVVW